ncbi:MAG: AAA family ATPase [Sphingomonadales bacterium]|nr:AAA family ATPase [Sphingomonadales bacterium]
MGRGGLHGHGSGNGNLSDVRKKRSDVGGIFKQAEQLIRHIAPSIKQLRPTTVSENAVRLDWIDDRDEVFGVHQMSDGTLRAIALVTALTQPEKTLPKFLCIDEPELGLHPAAIKIVAISRTSSDSSR